jgi:two-component system KDP operon response regulator KdpE
MIRQEGRDETARLTRGEPFSIFFKAGLAAHKNQVMPHKQLLTAVWSFTYRDDLDYLRAYIRYLRHKLEADPANPKLIVTCPGVGYSLECPEEKPS